MAQRNGWYLLAYDIADPKRLGRVYRLLKKEGIGVQGSVFFVQGTEEEIEELLNRLAALIFATRDDIRAYPITKPGDVWTTGTGRASGALILPKGKNRRKKSQKTKNTKNWKEKVITWFSFGKKK